MRAQLADSLAGHVLLLGGLLTVITPSASAQLIKAGHSQVDSPLPTRVPIQDYLEPELSRFDSMGADDFVVPSTQAWNSIGFFLPANEAFEPNAETLGAHVSVVPDLNGAPQPESPGSRCIADVTATKLPTGYFYLGMGDCLLLPGRYWVKVQIKRSDKRGDGSSNPAYAWQTRPATGFEGRFYNPGDGVEHPYACLDPDDSGPLPSACKGGATGLDPLSTTTFGEGQPPLDFRWYVEAYPTARCGDGAISMFLLHEECDDGNPYSGDGCSAECKIEAPIGTPGLSLELLNPLPGQLFTDSVFLNAWLRLDGRFIYTFANVTASATLDGYPGQILYNGGTTLMAASVAGSLVLPEAARTQGPKQLIVNVQLSSVYPNPLGQPVVYNPPLSASLTLTVNLDSPPTLEVSAPTDGQQVGAALHVTATCQDVSPGTCTDLRVVGLSPEWTAGTSLDQTFDVSASAGQALAVVVQARDSSGQVVSVTRTVQVGGNTGPDAAVDAGDQDGEVFEDAGSEPDDAGSTDAGIGQEDAGLDAALPEDAALPSDSGTHGDARPPHHGGGHGFPHDGHGCALGTGATPDLGSILLSLGLWTVAARRRRLGGTGAQGRDGAGR